MAAGWELGRAQGEGVGSGHEPAWPRAKLQIRNIILRLLARQDMLEKQGGDSRQQWQLGQSQSYPPSLG